MDYSLQFEFDDGETRNFHASMLQAPPAVLVISPEEISDGRCLILFEIVDTETGESDFTVHFPSVILEGEHDIWGVTASVAITAYNMLKEQNED